VAAAASTLLKPYPRLAIELRTIAAGNIGSALVEASRRAALVVVGSRGLGSFAGLLLGTVGRNLVHHAFCPVAIIH
jgi:nucleotide-binding universal stress UspA family protein